MKILETNQEKQRDYTRYKKNGNTYEPITETAEILPNGFYKPCYDSYNDRVYAVKKEIVMPKLYVLPNDIQVGILDDIKKFWESEERYHKFGQVYKRNILLYSVPGNGKTSLINILCGILVKEYNGIVFCLDEFPDLAAYGRMMERVRSIEPNRKVITVIEDFEHFAEDKVASALLLQTLDGNAQFDNVVTIATTNYPELLEKRFTCRPSRFNLVIEYKKPNAKIRRAFIINKLSDGGIDVNDENVKKDIERYVEKTEGYTFDFLKEAIQGIYVDGLTEVEIFDRLNKLKESDGKIKISEDKGSKIGFTNNCKEEQEVPCIQGHAIGSSNSRGRKIGFRP